MTVFFLNTVLSASWMTLSCAKAGTAREATTTTSTELKTFDTLLPSLGLQDRLQKLGRSTAAENMGIKTEKSSSDALADTRRFPVWEPRFPGVLHGVWAGAAGAAEPS